MAVLATGLSIIFRNPTIDSRLAGGMPEFPRCCPNRTFCTDGEICRIGFMASVDAAAFIESLRVRGLTALRDGRAVDLAATSEVTGLVWPCDWLMFHPSGPLPSVRATGSCCYAVAVPEGETKFASTMHSSSAEEFAARFEHVRSDGNVETFRDRETGDLVYQGHSMTPEREAATAAARAVRARFEEASSLIEAHLERRPRSWGARYWRRRQLRRAHALLDECAMVAPGEFDVHFWSSKVHHALGDARARMHACDRALAAAPGSAAELQEAGLAAFTLGLYENARDLTEIAVRLQPESADLRMNLAVSHLLAAEVEAASAEIALARQLNPKDQSIGLLLGLIGRVAQGDVPCPRDEQELQKALAQE